MPVFEPPAVNPNIREGQLLPPPPPNYKDETIPHRSSTHYHRKDRRRPRVPTSDEFQEFPTHRLNDLYEGMTEMKLLTDERERSWKNRFNAFEATCQQRNKQYLRWHGEYQGWHQQSEAHWIRRDQWQTVVQVYWKQQRHQTNEHHEIISQIQQGFYQEREERQSMSADITEMMHMMQDTQARFPPTQEE